MKNFPSFWLEDKISIFINNNDYLKDTLISYKVNSNIFKGNKTYSAFVNLSSKEAAIKF